MRCIFCGGWPVTREHIFRSSWKDKFYVSGVEREFVQNRDGRFSARTDAAAFELIVKRVCETCNNGWMKKLDRDVEEWLRNPDVAEPSISPKEFRRWAIKIAILRSLIDQPRGIYTPEDVQKLYAGEDVENWHIFVARCTRREHRHNFAGVGGGFNEDRALRVGVMQVSWSLDNVLVSCIRPVGFGAEESWVRAFKEYDRTRGGYFYGGYFTEVTSDMDRFPCINLVPRLRNVDILPYFWFFTDYPASPISASVRNMNSRMRAAGAESPPRNGRGHSDTDDSGLFGDELPRLLQPRLDDDEGNGTAG